jgi:hypothetical protein
MRLTPIGTDVLITSLSHGTLAEDMADHPGLITSEDVARMTPGQSYYGAGQTIGTLERYGLIEVIGTKHPKRIVITDQGVRAIYAWAENHPEVLRRIQDIRQDVRTTPYVDETPVAKSPPAAPVGAVEITSQVVAPVDGMSDLELSASLAEVIRRQQESERLLYDIRSELLKRLLRG